MILFTTAWLPEGAPNLAAVEKWLDEADDRELLEPGSLGYAPHLLGLPFDMEVPEHDALLDLLTEGSEGEQWFTRLADRLGTDGRTRYLSLSRDVAKQILVDLADDHVDADDLTALDLQNGRLVTAMQDTQETRHHWFKRLECLRHTYNPDLISTAGIMMLGDQGKHVRLEITG